MIAYPRQQRRILGESLHQYLFGAFEGRFHVRHHGIFFVGLQRLGAQVFLRLVLRHQQRIGEQ